MRWPFTSAKIFLLLTTDSLHRLFERIIYCCR
jgi:hypothetical protein